jgi:hypothetical protein
MAEVTVLMATRIARREEGRVSLKTEYMVLYVVEGLLVVADEEAGGCW